MLKVRDLLVEHPGFGIRVYCSRQGFPTMSIHVTWSSIGLLHNVVVTLNHLNNLGQRPLQPVRYRAKVKLHGMNAAVQVNSDGLVAQSRTEVLSPTVDLKGFAKWVAANESHFKALPTGIVVFGEWVGPGVEKGMAISQLPSKIFVVFAVQVGSESDARIVYDPDEIISLLTAARGCQDLHVLPWEETGDIVMDYSNKAQMESMTPVLNSLVDRIEKEDPWVKRTFGLIGVGEGLVFYPEPGSVPPTRDELALLMFKAKGEKHRTAGTKQSVQVDPTVVENATGFADLMVTEARLEQAVSQVCNGEYDMRHTSKFLSWVAGDVQKESAAELDAAGLEWKQVTGPVLTRAREWYKARCASNQAVHQI